MKHENMITVTAEIPEEFLEDWRVFVVIRGGRVLMPRSKQEKEHPSDWSTVGQCTTHESE